jgi:hypothetical protein
MVTGLQPRPVQVQMDDGTWVPGELTATHRFEGTWKGFVRYRERTNAAHFRWFDEAQVREQ